MPVSWGGRKSRLTGCEPLRRRDLDVLLRKLHAIEGVEDIALTTNAVLLADLAKPLYDAGLRRINIHLDTLDRERFHRITRRDALPKVMAGIEACQRLGYKTIKINAVAVKNLLEPDVVPLARFGRENNLQVRSLELHPLQSPRILDTPTVPLSQQLNAVL